MTNSGVVPKPSRRRAAHVGRPEARSGPPRRVVLATFGSLGDLHPYLAIARALRDRGHVPVVATSASYRARVHAEGLEHRTVRPDVHEYVPGASSPAEAWRIVLGTPRGPEAIVRTLVDARLREGFDCLAGPTAASWGSSGGEAAPGSRPSLPSAFPPAAIHSSRDGAARALARLLGHAHVKRRAAEAGRRIRAEDGAAEAARAVEDLVSDRAASS